MLAELEYLSCPINMQPLPAVDYYSSTDVDVDSSRRFPFRARTETDRQNDICDCPPYPTADVSNKKPSVYCRFYPRTTYTRHWRQTVGDWLIFRLFRQF